MTKLTEGMILARCRGAELDTIRKLNCWGSELTDISIVKKLPALEVLSLSVNNISTLADLQNCRMLQELYIRKNNIRDLAEICYLKDLRKLKCLWLADNPCAEVDGYRLTVLKHLPQIQKLDNVDVEPEEIREAQDRGIDLMHPLDRQPGGVGGYAQNFIPAQTYPQYEPQPHSVESYDYEEIVPPLPPQNPARRIAPASAPPSRKPSHSESAGGGDGMGYGMRRHSQIEPQAHHESSRMMISSYGVRRASVADDPAQPARIQEDYVPYQHPTSTCGGSMHPRQQWMVVFLDEVDSSDSRADQADTVPVSPQVDFSPEYNQLQQQRQQQLEEQLRRQDELRRQAGQQYAEAYHQAAEQIESFRNVNSSPTRGGYSSRPKHRSSNILSAVLCLLKELDVRSLEVVEMSARGRIEELLED